MARSSQKRSVDVLADLSAAFERLKVGIPLLVKAPYRINQSTVCKEAGRDRSSIKNQERFSQLRDAIDAAAKARQRELDSLRKVEEQAAHRLNELRQENRDLERSLDDAAATIYRLYFQLQSLEDDRSYMLERIADARRTSRAVDKVFELMNFDKLISH